MPDYGNDGGSPEGEELESCSIIVTEANEIMRPIHDRMPVILAPCDWDAWLEPDAKDAGGLQGLLKPYLAEGMAAWPVSTKVNSPRNDSVGVYGGFGVMHFANCSWINALDRVLKLAAR